MEIIINDDKEFKTKNKLRRIRKFNIYIKEKKNDLFVKFKKRKKVFET